jgi:putative ABC transport system permease protein
VGEPPSFQLAEGRPFAADFEAVVGSRAARELGLDIGDTFEPAHGVEAGLEEDRHEQAEHVVVGILRPSNTAFDGAILTSVSSVNAVHAARAHAEGEAHTAEPDSEDALAVTAILVRPTGFAEANLLWQEFYGGTEAQAAFPGAELGGIFDLLDRAQELLLGVGWLAALMAALTLFLAVFSAGVARERLLAIMRALGASRLSVSRVVLLESLLIAFAGAIMGRLLGYAVSFALAGQIAGESAVPMTIAYLPSLEIWLWLLPLAVGVVAGAIPAWQAYRAHILERLHGV